MPTLIDEGTLQQLLTGLLGRTNIRPRSITEDKLAVGAASAAVVRDGSISDVHIDTLTVDALTGGTISGESIVLTGAGTIESSNFVSGSAGFQINYDGSVEFTTGTFSGTLEAGEIHIPDAVTASSFHVDSSGQMWLGSTSFGAAPFRVTAAGAVTATGVTVTGSITTGSGSNIGAQYLSSGSTAANLTIDTGGWVRSQNYSAGSAGWAIDASGNAEFNDVTVRGDIEAGTITIGDFHVDSSGNMWHGGESSFAAARGFRLDASSGRIEAGNTVYFIDASGNLNGYLTTGGLIPGHVGWFTIDTDGNDLLVYPNTGAYTLDSAAATFDTGAVLFDSTSTFTVEPGSTSSMIFGYSGWSGALLVQGTNDSMFRMRDTSTTGNIRAYIRFEDSGGGLDGVVGMIDNRLQLRTYQSGSDVWLLADGDVLVGSSGGYAGTNLIGGDTTNHQGQIEWWTSSANAAMALYNDIAMASNPSGISITFGTGTGDPGTGADYMLFRKNAGSPTVVGSIDGNGSGGVRYNTTSDRRLKSNIRPFEGAEEFDLIPWRSYEMKFGRGEVTRHGVVAQDVHEDGALKALHPHVRVGGDEDHWGFDYTGIIGTIGGALADTRRELAALRDRVRELEAA